MDKLSELEPVLSVLNASVIAEDEDGTIIYMNGIAHTRYGELRGRPFREVFSYDPEKLPQGSGELLVFFHHRSLVFKRVDCGGLVVYIDSPAIDKQVLGLSTRHFAKLESSMMVTMEASKRLSWAIEDMDTPRPRELFDGDMPDPSRHMQVLRHATSQVHRIIYNRTLLTSLEEKRLKIRPLLMDTARVAEELCSTLRIFTERRGLQLDFSERTNGACYIRCQRNLFETLLLQILTNSFEHLGPDGRVELSVKQLGGTVLVSVDDNGSGISSQTIEQLAAGETEHGGMGLKIVTCAVRLLRGNFFIESRGESGTRACLSLPMETDYTQADVNEARRFNLGVGSDSGLSGMDLIFTELADWLDAEDYDPRLAD